MVYFISGNMWNIPENINNCIFLSDVLMTTPIYSDFTCVFLFNKGANWKVEYILKEIFNISSVVWEEWS